MKQYDSFKSSGVDWLGDIPFEWEVSKFKYATDIIMGQSPSSEHYNEDGLGTPFLQGNSEFGSIHPVHKLSTTQITKRSQEGDILFSVRGSVGEINWSDKEYCIGRGLCAIKSLRVDSKFVWYFLLFSKEEILSNSAGSTFVSVNTDDVRNLHIILPTIHQQSQIVSYLDRKTALIDSLIEKTERKIELLKEKRTALINQAVTKGLDPNVKMKDSGVEWIGEIPEHWEVSKVKYETKLVVDGAHFTPTYVDEGVPFLRVTDIQSVNVDLNRVKFIPFEEHQELIKRCNPSKGDLLLSKNGTIGLTKVVDWDWEFSIFVSLCLLRFTKYYSPHMFSYFFQSDVVTEQLNYSSKKSTVTNLHLDKIKELIVVKPPINEQQSLVEFLDKEVGRLELSMELSKKKMETLKEYRQALISEVVTGKRKVTQDD